MSIDELFTREPHTPQNEYVLSGTDMYATNSVGGLALGIAVLGIGIYVAVDEIRKWKRKYTNYNKK